MKDLVQNALLALTQLRDGYTEVGSVEEANADLEATNKALREAKAELVGVNAAVAQAQSQAARQHEEAAFRRRGEVEEIEGRIAKLRVAEAALAEEVRAKDREHRAIDVDFEAAKRRIN
jgi:hypothetical protein